MLAYSNKESLKRTCETETATYYSRSRKRLWTKGEKSGNIQEIKNLFNMFWYLERRKIMAGYMIHLAIGSVYAQNNEIEDLQSFYKGIIEPDMIDNKSKSHYGAVTSQPGLNKFTKLYFYYL